MSNEKREFTQQDAKEQLSNIYRKFNSNFQRVFSPQMYRCAKKFKSEEQAEDCVAEVQAKVDEIEKKVLGSYTQQYQHILGCLQSNHNLQGCTETAIKKSQEFLKQTKADFKAVFA